MTRNEFPIRIEAVRLDSQAAELNANGLMILKRRALFLLAAIGANILSSVLRSRFPESEGIFGILMTVTAILIIISFIRAGIALAMVFLTKEKDYIGGYIEVYSDHVVIKQRARYSNSDKWETGEIWFEDMTEMRNVTYRSNEKIYKYSLQHDRTNYVEAIRFRFRTTSRSKADMAIRADGSYFDMHFGGYNRAEMLELGRTIYSLALRYNYGLKYEEEPIIYKRILTKITLGRLF